jgi:hypothetical protein
MNKATAAEIAEKTAEIYNARLDAATLDLRVKRAELIAERGAIAPSYEVQGFDNFDALLAGLASLAKIEKEADSTEYDRLTAEIKAVEAEIVEARSDAENRLNLLAIRDGLIREYMMGFSLEPVQ